MLAEKLGEFDVAEKLNRQYAALPNGRDGTITLAQFLCGAPQPPGSTRASRAALGATG